MDQASTTFRPANPTENDGLAFARYLDEAAEGFFQFMLGRQAKHIIAATTKDQLWKVNTEKEEFE